MIPCRLQKRPFWEIYVFNNPPLWKALFEAFEYFDCDGYYDECQIDFKAKDNVLKERIYLLRKNDRYIEKLIYKTTAGNMTETVVYPEYDAPTKVEKVVKNFIEDFEKYKLFYPDICSYDASVFNIQKEEMGNRGVIGKYVGSPGIATMISFFQGSLEAATYAYFDHHDEFMDVVRQQHRCILRKTEMAIDAGVDFVGIGGSGDITLQSPEMWRETVLPTIKELTKICRQAGVISQLHTCGKERYVVEACYNETELDLINPLEPPQMGDVDLGEVKVKFGDRLCLMGNLHTSNVMLQGSTKDVEEACKKAIDDAGKNGGFILSTGDQCGRDTPDENIFKMVEVARTYGKY
ncbi:MAG: hypothetical protein FIA99_11490 [Ruminiclostridium sp.]|nr:hypothetical protein [Ruminiclostridium sp.]